MILVRVLLLGSALALALAAPAHAIEQTRASRLDGRIRTVPYEANNIVVLKTTMGNVLMVRFAPDENIVRVAEPDSARLKPSIFKNFLFLKPERLKGDPADFVLPPQTIIVLTDKGGHTRNYQFDFEAQKAGGDPDVTVDMTYPHDAWLKRQAALRAARRRAEAAAARDALRRETEFPSSTGGYDGSRNYRYVDRGDQNLAPRWAWDNGSTTYLYFPAMQRVPALFRGPCGEHEATADFSVHGDMVILPGMAPIWCLRNGHSALEIYDLAYTPQGATPATGTISPDVQRVLKQSDAR